MAKKGFNLRMCVGGNVLTILTVLGVFGGIALGLILKEAKDNWTPREISYVKLIGDLFLSMLKGLILPLIVSSLVAAVGSLDLSLSSKIGGRGIAFYMCTTVLAIILGIILAVTIQPGKRSTADEDTEEKEMDPALIEDTLLDLVRTMFPPNLVQATLSHYKTKLVLPINGTNDTAYIDYDMKETFEEGTNIMGLVVFSIVLGVALAKLGDKGKALLNMFQGLSEAMMLITGWVIWFSPIGVAFLISGEILRIDDFAQVLESLGLYFATVIAGLVIHGFIVLPLLFFILTKKLPFRYIANMTQAILTAFGTGSSSASLPITIKCLEENNNVDPRISRFLLPIGATINMDGTALYEAVAAIFIAQLVGIDLNVGKIIAISITATAASIGAAGIPQAGLVTMVMVLSVIGLPAHYISYIVPIDWLLDRFRTAINVLGDAFAAGVVNHLSQEELSKLVPLLPTTVSESEETELEHVKVNGPGTHKKAEQENQGFENEY